MGTQSLSLTGIMDLDNTPKVINPGNHKAARNIVWRGVPGNMRAENAPGARLIPYTLPAGNNECIGLKFFEVTHQLIYFNWNSTGKHGIYIYDSITEAVTRLIEVGINTTGDPLGFTLDPTIDSIDIIFGDPVEGNILFYVDTLGRPSKINIQKYLAGTYNPIKRSYLNVIKAPAINPIKAVYENDTTVTVNNLRNALFQFKYRKYYDDNNKSVWSTGSIVPLPNQLSVSLTNDDFTQNARISLFLETGDPNVKKLEIAARQVKDGVPVTDYFSVITLDKTALSIPNNDIYNFRFYNDGLYNSVDVQESIQLQDYVPRKTNSQTLLNGNVLGYAGILEGYDPVTANISMAVNSATGGFFVNYAGLLFFCAIRGIGSGATGTSLKIYLYGTGTNTAGNVTSLSNAKASFVINAVNGAGASIGTSYSNANDVETVANILAAISASLTTNGFTQVSLVGNILSMSYPTTITLQSFGVKAIAGSLNESTTQLAFPFQAADSVGVVYYDDDGRTNGVITAATGNFNTAAEAISSFSQPQITIKHQPPLWATYYDVVRTSNLTYNKRLYWVTDAAAANTNSVVIGDRYAYLGISAIYEYNQNIKATDGVVSYSFAKGDRVRIISRYDSSGALTTPFTVVDYEVLGTEIDPNINGKIVVGTFVKIKYPSADISATMKFDGDSDFINYKILLYNYKAHVSADQNFYYEFGMRFGIGDAGLATRYHMGLNQTQSGTNPISTPAIIDIVNGDLFSRTRNTLVPYNAIGSTGYQVMDISTAASIVFKDSVSGVLVDNGSFKIQDEVSYTVDVNNPLAFPTWADTAQLFYNKNATSSGTVLVKFKWKFSCKQTASGTTSFSVYALTCANLVPFAAKAKVSLLYPEVSVLLSGTEYNFTIDTIIAVPPTGKLYIAIVPDNPAIGASFEVYGNNDATIEVIRNINIPIIESSFSDTYSLVTNSNSRPLVVDPNAKETWFGTLFRYSQPYQLGTNINDTNRFYSQNFDEFEKSHGDVIKMNAGERSVRIYQQRKVGVIGVYQKFIKNNTGESQLIVSDTIITPNNIDYYNGDTGIGNSPDGFATNGYVDYFFDDVKGCWNRVSQDGIIQLNQKYLAQYYLPPIIKQYANPPARPNGGVAKILAAFNPFEDECVAVFQSGNGLVGDTLAFNEGRNAFSEFFDYQPDQIGCVNNKIVSFKNGALYIHDDEGTSRTFYGVGFYPSVDLIFNDEPIVKKDFGSIGYVSPQQSDDLRLPTVPIWEAPAIGDVETSLGLQSNLVYGDFEARENYYYAAFWGANTGGQYGIVDGNYLHGLWLRVHLRCATYGPTYLSSPFVNYLLSQKVL